MSQPTNLKVNIVLEIKEDGSAIASILELPQYRVAATREQALLALENLLTSQMQRVETIPVEINLPQSEQRKNPWMNFAGVFKDDPHFDVQQYIQEYRQELDAAKESANSDPQREASCAKCNASSSRPIKSPDINTVLRRVRTDILP